MPDGAIVIDNLVEPFGSLSFLPRIGLTFGMCGACDKFTWLGRGPFESYPDRKTAADVGLYTGTVADQYEEYCRPQENGNKEDVRWAALQDSSGKGILVQAAGPLSVSVQHFTPQQLEASRHKVGQQAFVKPLVPREDIILCLDHAQMGLGGASCGPAPMEKYRLKAEPEAFRLVLRPCTGDLSELGRKWIAVPPLS